LSEHHIARNEVADWEKAPSRPCVAAVVEFVDIQRRSMPDPEPRAATGTDDVEIAIVSEASDRELPWSGVSLPAGATGLEREQATLPQYC
jgi:hypothetical protein